MLAQILESQTKLVVEFNGKCDSLYTDLNGKINSLRSHISECSCTTAFVNVVTLHSKKQPNTILQREFSENTSSCTMGEKTSVLINIPRCRSTPIDLDDSVLPLSSGIDNFTEEEELLPDGVERHPPHVDRHRHHTNRSVLTFDRAGLMPNSTVDRHSPRGDRHWTQTAPIYLASPPITRQVYTPQVSCLLPR